jgi:hypothetical protein
VRKAAVPVGLALAGAAVAVFGGSTAATAVGVALLGFAGVAAMALVFYAIGRTEDRERAAAEFARRAAAREAAEAETQADPAAPREPPEVLHAGDLARMRRRPRPPRRPG